MKIWKYEVIYLARDVTNTKRDQDTYQRESFMRMGLKIFESTINFFEHFVQNGAIMVT